MTTTDQLKSGSGAAHQIGMVADRLVGIIRAVARPSLVQLVMVTMTRSLEEAFNPRLRRAG